jgi:hypothetical protein
VVPLCLVWLPLGSVPAGNVTVSDAVLAGLWILTIWDLVTRGLSDVDPRTPAMLLLALGIGLLAAIGSELNTRGGKGAFEFFLLLKRFGLAAVLPLAAVRFRSRAMGGWMRGLTLVAIAGLVIFALVPELQAELPRPPEWDANGVGERATALLTNPNDLAYSVVALAILNAAFLPGRPQVMDRFLLAAALGGSGICLVLAASRSGLLGAAAALTIVLTSRRIRARTKAALAACSAIVVVVGLSTSDAFEQRVTRAYRQGSEEENVSSRLDAQRLALRASIRYPLGVGFTGYAEATRGITRNWTPPGADSVYVETLLGAGVLGLAALLTLFATAWRHVVRSAPPTGLRVRILQAGMVAFIVFGTASVIPIAVSVSPLFFSMVAAASYPDARGDDL